DCATPRIAAFRCAVGMIAFAVLWIGAVDLCARDGSKDWIVLNNCRLIANPANDGDSFHVSAGPNEYIFRLYLVDAPETDEMVPRRLVDQAKYFGITVPQAIEVGRAAKEFTREKLSEPFTVFTHMSDAMGQSRIERLYAFVETKEGDLGEQLVRNGLARVFGFKAAPPGLRSARVEMEKLQQLENQARQEKIGGWGVNIGRLNAPAWVSGPFNHFGSNQEPRQLGRPAASPSPTPRLPTQIAHGGTPNRNKSHPKADTPLGKIDINTATEKELTTVPGIGHVMAARIIAARPFRSADDLRRVSGIGDKKYAQARPYFQ
ncbi:MAG TPA: helix-hairpin-helix domain-containing protein, partial [Terriglobales bacterium]|nr:helix-hairpin-helix domain-containing protein [Terriglobales bacterium]